MVGCALGGSVCILACERALSCVVCCVVCCVSKCASQSVTRVGGGECDRYGDEMRCANICRHVASTNVCLHVIVDALECVQVHVHDLL